MTAKKKEEISFEERVLRLQEIIEELERGNTPLQESLTLYKEGIEHAKASQTLLEKAQHEIKILQENELKDFTVID